MILFVFLVGAQGETFPKVEDSSEQGYTYSIPIHSKILNL